MTTVTPRHVGYAIAQLIPRIMQGIQLDFFVRRGVTQTQLLVTLAIHAYGRCSMTMLATSMHVRMPTATGIVDRLVRLGFVRRLPDAADRRQVLVEVTAKGKEFIRAFEGVIRRRWEEVLKSLTPTELASFHQVLTRLNQQLQSHD